jgi:PAS domain S-box-containing protein
VAAFEEHRPDCLVTCVETIPAALAARASRADCPIVDVSPEEAVDTDALGARITAAVESEPGAERDRITRLHSGSAELVGITDRQRLYDRTVSIASEILDFDIAVVFLRDPDQFRRVATTDDTITETRAPDKGVISQVFDTGEPALVDDIQNHCVAHTHSPEYRSGIAVPFGDVGVLVGLSTAYAAFDGSDLELAELLASHAAQVDGRLRAEEDLRERQFTITQLHRAAPELIDADSEGELYECTVDIAENVLEFDRSALFVAEDGAFTAVAGRGEGSDRVPPSGSVLSRTYEEGNAFLARDIQEIPGASPPDETSTSGLSVPVGDEAVFQALASERGTFDETDLEHAELLAAYADATLSRIHSEQALRESRRLIERLHDAATEVAAADTEQAVLDRAIDAAEEVLAFHQCAISLREGEMLVPAIESSESPTDGTQVMHISEGVKGKTARTGESFRVDEIGEGDETNPTRAEYRSGISIPVGDLAVFQAVETEPNAFDADDVHLAELLMAHVAVSLERVQAESELRAQRDRLGALFENVPGAAVSYEMIDGEPVVRRVNSGFERTFGYAEATVVDEPLDEFIVPTDAEAEAERYNTRLEHGERVQAEVERQTADGLRYFLLQVIPLEIGEENSRGYVIYTDVTEQREREAALRRQNERLDQFASVVSHDLRNPLNVASGYLDLARETGSAEQFDRVERALERMDELVADLLTLAREGRDVGETEPVALDRVAREAWGNVASAGVTLSVETTRTIEADRDRLVELLENLFRNTVEHARGENPAAADAEDVLTVTISNLSERDEWRGFVVADDGVGIDPSINPFEMGTTTSEHGTGFGLAIVESIAEAHGWSVSSTDREGGGTRFEFRVE